VHYGPWELFASLLTEGLVERGHDVTLFATGDSRTEATLSSVIPRGWSEDPEIDAKAAECLHIAAVFERADDFDIIHNSFDFLPLTYSQLVATPLVTTIHGFSSPRIVPVYEAYNGRTTYVAISDADRHPRLAYAATIHHGIDTDAFALHTPADPYLLFFGRIHPDKGTAHAIDVARAVGMPLVIAGIVHDQRYFDSDIAPNIDGKQVRYVGPVGADERSRLLGEAHALLHLIDFDEPFGLSVVEAMACGTPVVAFRRGSMPELIDDGVTGAIVDDVEAAVRAVGRVQRLDRAAIRATAVRRFGRDRMVRDYLSVYEQVLSRPSARPGAEI
jgi:glycosyltransferase involved in cell wall biosynthesis